MRRPDEIALYARLQALRATTPRGNGYVGATRMFQLFEELGIHPKRGWRLLEKWTTKRWWDYGTWCYGGWFTETAPPELTP